MAGQRQEYKGEETGLTGVWSLRICGDRILPFQSEDLVEVKSLSRGWLLCFSDLQPELQLCVWVFIILATFVSFSDYFSTTPACLRSFPTMMGKHFSHKFSWSWYLITAI